MGHADDRPLDVVVFGATGFTGRLVAAYLASTRQRRWGIAGRSYDALRRLRADLTSLDATAADVEVLVARADDSGALSAIAERARVIIAAAGPYGRLGEPLVAACIEAGTDYVDVSDEVGFFSTIVSRYHEAARRAGVLVVPCCGFRSVPSDLGLQFLLEQFPAHRVLAREVEVDAFVTVQGARSGGSWQSDLASVQAANGMPPSVASLHRRNGGKGMHFARATGRWAVPSRSIDAVVVDRSLALVEPAGAIEGVRYRQYTQVRSLPAAGAEVLAGGSAAVLSRLATARRVMATVAPPGSGPSVQARSRSWFRVRLVGRAGPDRVVVEVRGRDPHHEGSAKMVAEAARALLETPRVEHRGVSSPAAAMGAQLRARLEEAGVSFRVVARTMG